MGETPLISRARCFTIQTSRRGSPIDNLAVEFTLLTEHLPRNANPSPPETPKPSRRQFVRGLVTAPVAAAATPLASQAHAECDVFKLPADLGAHPVRVWYAYSPEHDEEGLTFDFYGTHFAILIDENHRMTSVYLGDTFDNFDEDLAFIRSLYVWLFRKGESIEAVLPKVRSLEWIDLLVVDGQIEINRGRWEKRYHSDVCKSDDRASEIPEPNPLDKNGLLPEASKGYVDIDSEDFEFNGDNRDFVWVDFAKEENPLPLISRLKAQGRHISSIDIAGLTDAEAESLADRLGKEGFFVGKRNGGMLLESKGLLV